MAQPWQQARAGVEVKLLPRSGELSVLARSKDRVAKERAMRRRQLKKLWARLAELTRLAPPRDALLLKLGAAKAQAPQAWRLVTVTAAADGALTYALRKDKLRAVTRREGRYLLRSNLSAADPARALAPLHAPGPGSIQKPQRRSRRAPIHHQLAGRIEAHIFVAFLAFCLHATLRHKLRLKAPGLTPRAALAQLCAMQMLDVHFPTTDGRTLIFRRYTMPDKVQKLLLAQLALELPPQTPPRITAKRCLEPLN